MLLGDDVSHRGQHHPHARLRAPHRARRARRRPPAQRRARAGPQRRRRTVRRSRARDGSSRSARVRPRSARGCARIRPTASRCASYARPTPASSSAARWACTRAPPTPRTSTSVATAGSRSDAHRASFIVPVGAPGVTGDLPQGVGPSPEPVPRAAHRPLRRARRPDVAGRRDDPVGARVPHRAVAGARRVVALLASALLLAREGGVHARPRARVRGHAGAEGARGDHRVPASISSPKSRPCARVRPRPSSIPSVRWPGTASRIVFTWRPGVISLLKARQRMAEILRTLPGSSLVVAPSDTDLADPEMRAGLEESFEGGGYTALQRSALLQLAADHVISSLDGRESRVRAARQRRHPGVARPDAASLCRLQRARERRAALVESRDAGDRLHRREGDAARATPRGQTFVRRMHAQPR